MITDTQCTSDARECRWLAQTANRDERGILFDMARTLETLAKHTARLERHQWGITSRILIEDAG